MDQLTPSNKFRIPKLGLVAIAGLLIALVAIFVFKVAVGVVLNYSFLAVMIMSHFFMHAGHGNHKSHNENANSSNPIDSLSSVPVENNNPQHRSHGCH